MRPLMIASIGLTFALALPFAVTSCGDDAPVGSAPIADTSATADAPPSGDTATPGDAATEADTSPTPPGGRNPVGSSITFTIEPFKVAPGTERQVCKVVNLPVTEPMELVRIRSKMQGLSHHFNLYKVIDDRKLEPASPAEAMVRDCAPANEQLSGDAAYIFGSATRERIFDTPEGVAFHLEPGQRLILEYHALNFTPAEVEAELEVELFHAGEGADIRHHASIMWFANWGFILPPGQETSSTRFCEVPYDVEVFGLMSHFHELGTNFIIEAVTAEGTTQVYEDDDWAHPKYGEYWPPISLRAGEGLRWTCTWFNHRSHVVLPNRDSTDEMCITFAAVYPKSSLSGPPIQCNVVF